MQKVLIMLAVGALVALSSVGEIFAQTGGQFCVRAFEDRNANGTLDPGEPFLTRGVSAQLMDASGVIVSSALLDNSPTATQGVICFTGLSFGQYSMIVTSADFQATTPNQMTVAISPGQLPTVLDFGAQRITAQATGAPVTEAAIDREALIERALVAALGAAVVIVFMAALGTLIYLLFFRGRLKRAAAEAAFLKRQSTTGSFPVVQPGDTGEYRRY